MKHFLYGNSSVLLSSKYQHSHSHLSLCLSFSPLYCGANLFKTSLQDIDFQLFFVVHYFFRYRPEEIFHSALSFFLSLYSKIFPRTSCYHSRRTGLFFCPLVRSKILDPLFCSHLTLANLNGILLPMECFVFQNYFIMKKKTTFQALWSDTIETYKILEYLATSFSCFISFLPYNNPK